MLKRIIVLATIIVVSYSCIGYYPKEIFTPLQDETINCTTKDTIVDLYFEGEPINFEYEKIGLIEVHGANLDNDKDVILLLKKMAIEKCCNAIIGIKKGNTVRESGLVFVEKHEYTYNSTTYFGVGVRKK
ncbi:conserved hypothetical protein [Flavobacterium sp. 9AF]|uniref:hypothetical protein n=1 Tax=Flavobacterium sp. 9AF TaxID=2653142 RepID=UPI0012F40FE2|nr:hypothetical protein [Flavobacterium sp. 9AF]VXC22857.1 conserved hypothetical protein [Flavobacterium sp. 9AF]